MVDAGYGIQKYHARAEYRRCCHLQSVASPDQHQHQRCNRKKGTESVRNSVKQFFFQTVGRDRYFLFISLSYDSSPIFRRSFQMQSRETV